MDPQEIKSPPEGMGVPSMMKQMMEKMCSRDELSPVTMCREMMSWMGKTAETAACATPELRKASAAWLRSLEDEVLATLRAGGPLDLAKLAGALRMSPESALHLLGKLVREGKVTIGSIRNACGVDATV